jgi:hypothetical protein
MTFDPFIHAASLVRSGKRPGNLLDRAIL